jgi:phospholipase/carboxylesterase
LQNGITPRFFHRLAEGVFDIEDLKFRTNELADFVNDASKTYEFDLQRTIALGYSNGANIAASMLLLRPEILSAAILFRAMVHLCRTYCQILVASTFSCLLDYMIQ